MLEFYVIYDLNGYKWYEYYGLFGIYKVLFFLVYIFFLFGRVYNYKDFFEYCFLIVFVIFGNVGLCFLLW